LKSLKTNLIGNKFWCPLCGKEIFKAHPERIIIWKRNLQTAPTRQQLSSKIFLCGKEINKHNITKREDN